MSQSSSSSFEELVQPKKRAASATTAAAAATTTTKKKMEGNRGLNVTPQRDVKGSSRRKIVASTNSPPIEDIVMQAPVLATGLAQVTPRRRLSANQQVTEAMFRTPESNLRNRRSLDSSVRVHRSGGEYSSPSSEQTTPQSAYKDRYYARNLRARNPEEPDLIKPAPLSSFERVHRHRVTKDEQAQMERHQLNRFLQGQLRGPGGMFIGYREYLAVQQDSKTKMNKLRLLHRVFENLAQQFVTTGVDGNKGEQDRIFKAINDKIVEMLKDCLLWKALSEGDNRTYGTMVKDLFVKMLAKEDRKTDQTDLATPFEVFERACAVPDQVKLLLQLVKDEYYVLKKNLIRQLKKKIIGHEHMTPADLARMQLCRLRYHVREEDSMVANVETGEVYWHPIEKLYPKLHKQFMAEVDKLRRHKDGGMAQLDYNMDIDGFDEAEDRERMELRRAQQDIMRVAGADVQVYDERPANQDIDMETEEMEPLPFEPGMKEVDADIGVLEDAMRNVHLQVTAGIEDIEENGTTGAEDDELLHPDMERRVEREVEEIYGDDAMAEVYDEFGRVGLRGMTFIKCCDDECFADRTYERDAVSVHQKLLDFLEKHKSVGLTSLTAFNKMWDAENEDSAYWYVRNFREHFQGLRSIYRRMQDIRWLLAYSARLEIVLKESNLEALESCLAFEELPQRLSMMFLYQSVSSLKEEDLLNRQRHTEASARAQYQQAIKAFRKTMLQLEYLPCQCCSQFTVPNSMQFFDPETENERQRSTLERIRSDYLPPDTEPEYDGPDPRRRSLIRLRSVPPVASRDRPLLGEEDDAMDSQPPPPPVPAPRRGRVGAGGAAAAPPQPQDYLLKKHPFKPLSVDTEFADCMVFPELFPDGNYGFHHRNRSRKMDLAAYGRARLLNRDRRWALSNAWIIFMYQYHLQKDLTSLLGVQARIGEGTSGEYLLEKLGDPQFTADNLTSIFGKLRNFPPYWHVVKMKLRSHLVSFGSPTWFLTLNPAIKEWKDMHNLYAKLHNLQPGQVNANNIAAYIARDPAPFSRYFNKRVRSFFKDFLKAGQGPPMGEQDDRPLGGIDHFFLRYEWQAKGYEHAHCLLWARNKPSIDASDDEIRKYLDLHLSARLPDKVKEPRLHWLIKEYQSHYATANGDPVHNKTCLRQRKYNGRLISTCRFEISRPLLAQTIVMKEPGGAFEFAGRLIRRLPGVRRKAYYLQRVKKEEQIINDYNPGATMVWGGNTDLQYLREHHVDNAIIDYVTSYTAKSASEERKAFSNGDVNEEEDAEYELDECLNVDKDLGGPEEAAKERQPGTSRKLTDAERRLFLCFLKLLRLKLTGMLEMCDVIMQHRLFEFDTEHVYCNTQVSRKRRRMIKPKKDLVRDKQSVPYVENWNDTFYPLRDSSLEEFSLFNLMSNFEIVDGKRSKSKPYSDQNDEKPYEPTPKHMRMNEDDVVEEDNESENEEVARDADEGRVDEAVGHNAVVVAQDQPGLQEGMKTRNAFRGRYHIDEIQSPFFCHPTLKSGDCIGINLPATGNNPTGFRKLMRKKKAMVVRAFVPHVEWQALEDAAKREADQLEMEEIGEGERQAKEPTAKRRCLNEGEEEVDDELEHKKAVAEDFHRCLCVLFIPFRNEETMLEDNNCDSYDTLFNNYLADLQQYYPDAYADIAHWIREQSKMKQNDAMRIAKYARVRDIMQNAQIVDGPGRTTQDYQGLGNLDSDEIVAEETERYARYVNVTKHLRDLGLMQNNPEQMRVYNQVMEKVERLENPLNKEEPLMLFVSGLAGTGKSFLINNITDALTLRYTPKAEDRLSGVSPNVILAAPTGMAGVNIGGGTVHSVLHIQVRDGFLDLPAQVRDRKRAIFKHVKVFIIDEVSMCSNVLLMQISIQLQTITGNMEPFGGINTLVFGDLLQLPPVKAKHCFVKLPPGVVKEKFGLPLQVQAPLWLLFDYRELLINQRQGGDKKLAEALARMRVGQMTDDDHKLFESRMLPTASKKRGSLPTEQEIIKAFLEVMTKVDDTVVALFPLVEEATHFNYLICQALGKKCEVIIASEEAIRSARDLVMQMQGRVSRTVQEEAEDAARRKRHPWAESRFAIDEPSNVDDKRKNERRVAATSRRSGKLPDICGGLLNELTIAVGSRVMLTRNINFARKLVNGSRGVLLKIITNRYDKPERLRIQFDTGDIFDIRRSSHIYTQTAREIRKRTQFPVQMCFAATIHKSQGQTFSSVFASTMNIFADGQMFVLMSRVQALAGLYLMDYFPDKIRVDRRALMEVNRLRSIHEPPLEPYDMPPEPRKRMHFNKQPRIGGDQALLTPILDIAPRPRLQLGAYVTQRLGSSSSSSDTPESSDEGSVEKAIRKAGSPSSSASSGLDSLPDVQVARRALTQQTQTQRKGRMVEMHSTFLGFPNIDGTLGSLNVAVNVIQQILPFRDALMKMTLDPKKKEEQTLLVLRRVLEKLSASLEPLRQCLPAHLHSGDCSILDILLNLLKISVLDDNVRKIYSFMQSELVICKVCGERQALPRRRPLEMCIFDLDLTLFHAGSKVTIEQAFDRQFEVIESHRNKILCQKCGKGEKDSMLYKKNIEIFEETEYLLVAPKWHDDQFSDLLRQATQQGTDVKTPVTIGPFRRDGFQILNERWHLIGLAEYQLREKTKKAAPLYEKMAMHMVGWFLSPQEDLGYVHVDNEEITTRKQMDKDLMSRSMLYVFKKKQYLRKPKAKNLTQTFTQIAAARIDEPPNPDVEPMEVEMKPVPTAPFSMTLARHLPALKKDTRWKTVQFIKNNKFWRLEADALVVIADPLFHKVDTDVLARGGPEFITRLATWKASLPAMTGLGATNVFADAKKIGKFDYACLLYVSCPIAVDRRQPTGEEIHLYLLSIYNVLKMADEKKATKVVIPFTVAQDLGWHLMFAGFMTLFATLKYFEQHIQGTVQEVSIAVKDETVYEQILRLCTAGKHLWRFNTTEKATGVKEELAFNCPSSDYMVRLLSYREAAFAARAAGLQSMPGYKPNEPPTRLPLVGPLVIPAPPALRSRNPPRLAASIPARLPGPLPVRVLDMHYEMYPSSLRFISDADIGLRLMNTGSDCFLIGVVYALAACRPFANALTALHDSYDKYAHRDSAGHTLRRIFMTGKGMVGPQDDGVIGTVSPLRKLLPERFHLRTGGNNNHQDIVDVMHALLDQTDLQQMIRLETFFGFKTLIRRECNNCGEATVEEDGSRCRVDVLLTRNMTLEEAVMDSVGVVDQARANGRDTCPRCGTMTLSSVGYEMEATARHVIVAINKEVNSGYQLVDVHPKTVVPLFGREWMPTMFVSYDVASTAVAGNMHYGLAGHYISYAMDSRGACVELDDHRLTYYPELPPRATKHVSIVILREC